MTLRRAFAAFCAAAKDGATQAASITEIKAETLREAGRSRTPIMLERPTSLIRKGNRRFSMPRSADSVQNRPTTSSGPADQGRAGTGGFAKAARKACNFSFQDEIFSIR